MCALNAEEAAHVSGIAGPAASGDPAADPRRGAPSPAAAKPSSPSGRRPPAYRIGGRLLSVVVILAIFAGLIPRFASYRDAWTAVQKLSPGWCVAIAAATIISLAACVWPYQAALPRLRYWHGFMEIQTSTAVSTTVPAGGALAIGFTYRMFGSFGFSDVAITSAVATTGIWNLGFKLALPIAAVVLMAVTGQRTHGMVGYAAGGVVLLVALAAAAWLTFRNDASARWLGRLGDRIVNSLLRLARRPPSHRLERAVLRFRDQTNDSVRERGWLLTAGVLGSQVATFALVLFGVRAAGIPAGKVSFLAVLLSFAIARLAGAVPITPGGLGSVDAAFTGMLTAFGATASTALAADLLWRAATYFPPIFIGVVTYVLWKRGLDKGAYARAPDEGPPGIPASG